MGVEVGREFDSGGFLYLGLVRCWSKMQGPLDPLEKGTAAHSSILAWRIA